MNPATVQVGTTALKIADAEISTVFPPGCKAADPSCLRAQSGYEILIVWLARADGGAEGDVSDKLIALRGQIALDAGGMAKVPAAGAGMINLKLFVMFTTTASAPGYQLLWPGENPIPLTVRARP
jgi:hypothetical protein